MRKNVASQKIGAQLVSATDGSEFTGSVTVYVTVDAGTQAAGSVGSGACAHEGHGYHTYAPAQAETNGNLIAFTFVGTGAVPVTVQVETESFDRHDTDDLGLANLLKLADGGLTAATFAADTDGYAFKLWLQRKSTSTAKDKYRGIWLKNGVEVHTGITLPKINVKDTEISSGADIIAEVAMTPINTYVMAYDAVGAELLTAGGPIHVIVKATIDGQVRTCEWIQGRDA